MNQEINLQLAGMLGGQEILIILIIVLILFGGKKIPELMKGLGKGMKEYKKAINGIEEELSTEEKTQENVKSAVEKGGSNV